MSYKNTKHYVREVISLSQCSAVSIRYNYQLLWIYDVMRSQKKTNPDISPSLGDFIDPGGLTRGSIGLYWI